MMVLPRSIRLDLIGLVLVGSLVPLSSPLPATADPVCRDTTPRDRWGVSQAFSSPVAVVTRPKWIPFESSCTTEPLTCSDPIEGCTFAGPGSAYSRRGGAGIVLIHEMRVMVRYQRALVPITPWVGVKQVTCRVGNSTTQNQSCHVLLRSTVTPLNSTQPIQVRASCGWRGAPGVVDVRTLVICGIALRNDLS
jgi:hypothetical protein